MTHVTKGKCGLAERKEIAGGRIKRAKKGHFETDIVLPRPNCAINRGKEEAKQRIGRERGLVSCLHFAFEFSRARETKIRHDGGEPSAVVQHDPAGAFPAQGQRVGGVGPDVAAGVGGEHGRGRVPRRGLRRVPRDRALRRRRRHLRGNVGADLR